MSPVLWQFNFRDFTCGLSINKRRLRNLRPAQLPSSRMNLCAFDVDQAADEMYIEVRARTRAQSRDGTDKETEKIILTLLDTLG